MGEYTDIDSWQLTWKSSLETVNMSKNPSSCSMRRYTPISGLREVTSHSIDITPLKADTPRYAPDNRKDIGTLVCGVHIHPGLTIT